MTKDRIRLALITVWYPPSKGIAVQRMTSFVNYLSEHANIQLDVFSLGDYNQVLQEKANVTNYQFKNKDLINYFKSDRKDSFLFHNFKTILRIFIQRILKSRYKNWRLGTLKQLELNHKVTPYDVVISSYAPAEAHQIVIQFLELGYKVPWIADMRDEMSLNPGISLSLKTKLIAIEKQVNFFATGLTSVSLPILNDFRKICPDIKFFEEIRNGYDHNFQLTQTSNTVFTIGYFGSFYGSIKPTNFFDALKLFQEDYPNFLFKIELYGVHNNFVVPHTIADFVHVYEALPYEKAIERMSTMDVNLLLLPNQERKGVYSGKIFDYISVRKPILACVDPSDVASELIQALNCGYVVDFNEVNEIKSAILNAYNDWENGILKAANEEEVKNLHRKVQVEKLYYLIEKVIA